MKKPTKKLASRASIATLHDDRLAHVGGGNIATEAYQAFMTALKSVADSKSEVQQELARFR